MYMNQFGNVVIAEIVTRQSGLCLTAQIPGTKNAIFMDVRNSEIPDGQTAYLFGNKVIITVHWAGFNEEDMANCFGNDLKLRIGCLETGIFMFCKFGSYPWGDVITCPGLVTSLNDMSKEFDEIIFVFLDSNTGRVVGCRSYEISGPLAEFIRQANGVSYMYFHQHGEVGKQYHSIREIHDDWSNMSMRSHMQLRMADLEQISNASGLYGLDADATDFARFYRY